MPRTGLSTVENGRLQLTVGENRMRVRVGWVVLLLTLTGFLSVTLILNLRVHTEQQFAFLARSFLHGDLAFQQDPGESWADTSPHDGHYYWPLGPLPAVILMP